jgi:hypothetical protein
LDGEESLITTTKPKTWPQNERQRHRDNGKYAKVNPCYRCGKSAGVDYCSFLADTTDECSNAWDDKALCVCGRCNSYLWSLYRIDPSAPWDEAMSSEWGKLPQGKAQKMPDEKTIMGRPRVGTAISMTLTKDQLAWIDTQLLPGASRAAFIRSLIHAAMLQFKKAD